MPDTLINDVHQMVHSGSDWLLDGEWLLLTAQDRPWPWPTPASSKDICQFLDRHPPIGISWLPETVAGMLRRLSEP